MPSNLLDFGGKTVIVTGAGSGLGRGIARRFAEAGAKVVVHYFSSEAGACDVVAGIKAAGGTAVAVRADVRVTEQVEHLVARSVSEFGSLDVLINNAGIYPMAPLLEMTGAQLDAMMAANLRSVHLCTQAAARQMIQQQRGGAIVNIASIEAENPAPNHAHYDASKAGVLMYTRAAANELGPLGVRVNAVSPGVIWREGIEQAWPEGVNRYRAAAPLGRLGTPADVANACLFLASGAAGWITGANLVVDGGVLTNRAY